MRTITRRFAIAICLLAVAAEIAAAGEDAEARAEAVAPFIESQTIAVARIDVARLDVKAFLDKVLEIMPEAEEARENLGVIEETQRTLIKARANVVYAVFSLADRITVLVYGRAVATGTPDEIRANAEVREAYLGEEIGAGPKGR